MKKLSATSKWGMLVLLGVVLATGFASMEQGRALALIPPGPMCGPDILWICVVPGCPTCPDVLFGGTVCDRIEFEKETGRVCTPFPG